MKKLNIDPEKNSDKSCLVVITTIGKDPPTSLRTEREIIRIYQGKNGGLNSFGKELALFLKEFPYSTKVKGSYDIFPTRVATEILVFIRGNPLNEDAQIVEKIRRASYVYHIEVHESLPIINLRIYHYGIFVGPGKEIFIGSPNKFISALDSNKF